MIINNLMKFKMHKPTDAYRTFRQLLNTKNAEAELIPYLTALVNAGHSNRLTHDEIWEDILDFWTTPGVLERARFISKEAWKAAEKAKKGVQDGK